MARLHASTDDASMKRARQEIAAAVQSASCVPSIVPADFCEEVLATGRQWLGWMALHAGNLDEAAAQFSGSAASGWPAWVAGLKAFGNRNYAGSATQYSRAIEVWKSVWQAPGGPSFRIALGPRPDLAPALTELGAAEMLAADTKAAVATLDAAIKANPSDARALFLRARARELGGQKEQALEDYNMASRTAFANARDLASGEAHLYRGIVLYRRQEFGRAENEFLSALNFQIPASMRSDTIAWRRLAAVAGGACTAARQDLVQSLATVSPYFPNEEARTLAASCTSASMSSSANAEDSAR